MRTAWYIVGLGNPGPEYAQTRHNAGRWLMEAWAEKQSADWKVMKKLQASVAKAGEWVFIKPETFMNDSGSAVRAVLDYFEHFDQMSLPNQAALLKRVLVAHDDLDLEFGKTKLQLGRGPKVHNGLLSIYQHVGSQNFWHGRIGVDGRGGSRHQSPRDYVLQTLTLEEQLSWASLAPQLIDQWQRRLTQEFDKKVASPPLGASHAS